jgi:hypothetical protein
MGARALNVDQHHRLMYAQSVQMVAQQMTIPARAAVTEIAAKGEAQSTTDLLDAGEYQYGEVRARTNPINPVTGSRRWLIQPLAIESGDHIDKEDKFATATDPTSDYVTVHTSRVRRGIQDRIFGVRKDPADGLFRVVDGGILGNATSGKRAETTSVLPAGQSIAVAGTGLTVAKLQAALKKLRLAEFGMEDMDPLYAAITANQMDDLLSIAAASSTPLNAFTIEQLKTGKPTSLLGVTWIPTNRLPMKDGTATTRLIPVWSKRNIKLGVWQDLTGDMWNDTSAKNLPYAYVSAYVDCVRDQDTGVVAIECLES